MARYLGIDIGGTKCAVSLGNERAEVLREVRFATSSREETLTRLLAEAERLCREAEEPVDACGISCGGPLDPAAGLILSPPNLPGWDRVPIVRLLEDRLGIPAVLANDADACALAEWQFGAGKGCRHMVFLTFGTGLGAGLILNGQLYQGAGSAGEAGHLRLAEDGPEGYGKRGSFEGFCSGGGIARAARQAAEEALAEGLRPLFCPDRTELGTISAKTVAEAAEKGDETALRVYRKAGGMLGRGLAVLIDLLNPERIVIGSIYARSGHLMKEEMERVLREECLPGSLADVRIVPAALGEDVGSRAALSLALSAERRQ